MLPGLTGGEVLHRIRRANSQVPVLILTARDSLSMGPSLEPTCDGFGRHFSTFSRNDAVTWMRGRCDGGPASGGGWESVHGTTLDTIAEQSRRQVGPTILLDRPWPGSPAPPPSDFPVGRPLGGDQCRAEVRWERRNSSTVARRQVATVRKRRATGDAMAAQRAAGGNRYTVQRSLRWRSRTDVRWGPRFSSTTPGRDPPSLLHQISPWGGRGGDESRADV
jgi:hypothetical protein